MASVSTYLNFNGNTEEAFNFYKTVFKTEFNGSGIMRFSDVPAYAPASPKETSNMVMYVEIDLMGGYKLMGTDAPESMGFKLKQGNNVYINLEPDSREETDRLFQELSAGGKVEMELQDMFWGAYFGSCEDKFGIHWMFNCVAKK